MPNMLVDSLIVKDRQRKEFDPKAMEELKNDIVLNGLLHAVVVNTLPDSDMHPETWSQLIAGERRLRCVTALAEEGIHIKYGDKIIPVGEIPVNEYFNLTELQCQEVELSENIKRRDLTWQELSAASAMLHKMRQGENPKQTYADTAKEIKTAQGDPTEPSGHERTAIREAEILSGFEDDKDVMGAKDRATAMKIAKRKMEQEFNDALDTEGMFNALQVEDGEMLEITQSRHRLYPVSMEWATEVIDPGTVDVMIFDPPYGIGVENFGGAQHLKHEYAETDYEYLYDMAIQQAGEITKAAAHMYIFCDFEFCIPLRSMLEHHGWSVHRTPIIWDKGPRGHLTSGGTLGWRRSSEYVIFATRGGKQNTGLLSDVLRIVDGSEKFHAAQKPVELYELFMGHSADPGDVVCDLFAGSGVVFEAAENMNMTAIGFEIDQDAVGMIGSRRDVFPQKMDKVKR